MCGNTIEFKISQNRRHARGPCGAPWACGRHPVPAGLQTELPVFRLPRKAARLTPLRTRRATLRHVTAVEDQLSSVPVRCIQVDHPSHTYLAGRECVPTHNTTIALHAVASAQKAGGIAAFIDAEHALDPDYAKKLGVDTDALLVSQPDTGEQALEIADMLIRSGAIDVVVIDSVAALVPRAEIEGEMGDSHVGLQARLMSQALRKITGALSQTKTTAIFINQLREKVGVMFGCMSYATRVTLADGTQEKIGKIVNQRQDVEVLSYDPESGRIVPRRIVNWFNNGRTERFLQFTVAKSGGNGRAQFAATENHLVRTPGGWREAGELIPGDRVALAEPWRLSGQQMELILGALMGDGSLSPNPRGGSGTRFRMGHGAKQAAYLDWKVSLLGNIGCALSSNAKGAVFADLTPLPELAELREAVYFGDGKKHLSWEYLKALTPFALAVWYMDDGCFTVRSKGVQERTQGGTGRIEICVQAMSPGSRERLAGYLRDTHQLDVRVVTRGSRRPGHPAVHHCGVREIPEACRALHSSVDGVQAPATIPRAVPGRAGVRPGWDAPGASQDPGHPRQAADEVDEPVRHRGWGIAQLLRQRGHGAQQPRDHQRRAGAQVLRVGPAGRAPDRDPEGRHRGRGQPDPDQGGQEQVPRGRNARFRSFHRYHPPHRGNCGRAAPVHVVSTDKRGVLQAGEVVSWFDQGEQDVIGADSTTALSSG